MKIRNGFVSNSSSSSFVILGVPQKDDFDYEELKKLNFESLYVEENDYDYIIGYVISDDEELDFTETTIAELQEKAQEIATKLNIDINEVKLYTGIRPC